MIFWVCAVIMTAYPVAWSVQAPQKLSSARNNAAMVSLGFTNATIYNFIVQMAERIGLTPMIVDPAVQGNVNFNITIPQDDLFYLFNAILKNNSAALVRTDNIYQVVPMSFAIRSGLEIINEQPAPIEGDPSMIVSPAQQAYGMERAREDSGTVPVATHVIRLDLVPVEDIVEAVRLFISDGVSILTFKRLNLMIITDYLDNIERVKEFIRMLDTSYLNPNMSALIKIENSNALDITEELKKIFGSSAGDNATTGVSFVPLERLNAIFVMAGTKRGLDEAKRWIEELDTYDGNKIQTFVYTVQESTALNIATMLSALYSDDSTGSSYSTYSTSKPGGRTTQGTSSSSLLNQGYGYNLGSFGSAQQLGPRLDASSPSITSIILRGGAFSNLRDEVRVVVDDANNVLHIQSTPNDYRFLLNAIEKMDVSPRQVLIDVQIYEVTLNNDLSYGFRGALEARTENNITGGRLNEGGLLSVETFAYVGNTRQIMLAIDALKTRTRVKVLEHPSVLAMDGNQASFVSGAEVPYPTESFITTAGSTTGMGYRETGVSLHVIPRISASGTVTMEIVQEVSTVSERTMGALSAPIFPKTSVQTVLSVKDGQTVAIAGLIRDTNTWGRAGIPFLSDIPIVGALFGGTTDNKNRTELVVLITPYVIKTPDRFLEVTQTLVDSMRNARMLVDEHESRRVSDIEDAVHDRERREHSKSR